MYQLTEQSVWVGGGTVDECPAAHAVAGLAVGNCPDVGAVAAHAVLCGEEVFGVVAVMQHDAIGVGRTIDGAEGPQMGR